MKKAEGLPITIIVVAVMALLVLVIVLVIFTGKIGESNKGFSSCIGKGAKCVYEESSCGNDAAIPKSCINPEGSAPAGSTGGIGKFCCTPLTTP